MKKFIVIFFANFLFTENCHAQIEANEWCPKGTWWAYTWQPDIFYKDRNYDIYQYNRDTIMLNKPTKIILLYSVGTELVYKNTISFDSIVTPIRFSYNIYLQNRSDSIFIRSDFLNYDTSRREWIDTTFKFYYKVKFAYSERITYSDTAGHMCYNHSAVYYTDTMINIKSVIDTFRNYQGKTCYVKTYKNVFKQKRYLHYDDILHNMVPSEKFYYLFRLDSINSFISKKYKDTLCNRSYGENPWNTPRIEALMCYYQGGQGYLIDNYIKGDYSSGCEYLKLALDKSSIVNASQIFNFIIFPNPATDYLIIENNSQKVAQVILQSMDGKIILKEKLDRNINKIWIDFIPNGKYVLYIVDPNGLIIKTEKIVKN